VSDFSYGSVSREVLVEVLVFGGAAAFENKTFYRCG
jgi:hypothetical protein